MTAEIGHYALVLALALALIQSVVPILGTRLHDNTLMSIAGPTALAQLLKQEPGWKTVADDGEQILLVRDRALVPVAGNSPLQPRF